MDVVYCIGVESVANRWLNTRGLFDLHAEPGIVPVAKTR